MGLKFSNINEAIIYKRLHQLSIMSCIVCLQQSCVDFLIMWSGKSKNISSIINLILFVCCVQGLRAELDNIEAQKQTVEGAKPAEHEAKILKLYSMMDRCFYFST